MYRTSSYRVEVTRSGAAYKTLRCVEPPRVDMVADGEITRSMSGVFLYDPDVRLLTDELRVLMILDGVEYPLGIFRAASVQDQYTDTGTHQIRVEAYDRAYVLSRQKTENILHLSAGTPYLTAIDQLMADAGIVLQFTTPCDSVLATAREDWDVGTSHLTIINQLLSEINYMPVWFDANGYAVLKPEATASVSESMHTYGGRGAGFQLVRRAASEQVDSFGVPNVFIVICDNPDYDTPMKAVAVNDNPLSSLSVLNMGQRIAEVYKVDNIADQAALQAYADNLCRASIFRGKTVDITTAATPGHGCGDIVTLNHPDVGGVYRETAWSITLGAGGGMTHTLERVQLV